MYVRWRLTTFFYVCLSLKVSPRRDHISSQRFSRSDAFESKGLAATTFLASQWFSRSDAPLFCWRQQDLFKPGSQVRRRGSEVDSHDGYRRPYIAIATDRHTSLDIV